jgi:glycosyltransferase involved in cell wall biosynthesis
MEKGKRIKVVWLCNFSDSRIREKINFSKTYFKYVICKITGRPVPIVNDFGVWVSNAIHEFEKFNDIDVTVVFPYLGIKGSVQRFDIQNIHYICFKSEDDNLLDYYRIHRRGYVKKSWNKNRRIISEIVIQINPDIVHIIGAENPFYSIAALDVPSTIPCVVSPQTLLSAPEFHANYPIAEDLYKYRSELEQQIIKRSDYIAMRARNYKQYIKNTIKPDAVVLQMALAVGEDVNTDYEKKDFDFVYYAANINKACDDAIEAFAIAHQRAPQLTLNISGSCDENYRAKMDKRIKELDLSESVFFTGPQPTHADVLRQIKKSRYALLPLKVDLISSTIREAMACGLPVVTTFTPATPNLNRERESVLLSEKGDYEMMAMNMLKLMQDVEFAEKIRQNAIKTVSEQYGNEGLMRNWRKAYYQIIENFHNRVPFTDDVLSF